MVLNAPGFVRRPLPVFARLIDDCCGEQLGGIELADSESIEPCLLPAREAMKLCAPNVPQLDVNAIGAALAEQEDGHGSSVAGGEQKTKRVRKSPVQAFCDRLCGHVEAPANGCGSGSRIDSAPDRSRLATLLGRHSTRSGSCDVSVLVVCGSRIAVGGRFDAPRLPARPRRKRSRRTFSGFIPPRRPPGRRIAAPMERTRTASDLDGGHAVPTRSRLARTQRCRRRRAHQCSGVLITAMPTVRAPGHASICRRA
jgi:hypothetical protein